MYTIKPIIDSTIKLEGPLSTMYHMRNIYDQRSSNSEEASHSTSAKLDTTAMSALENRQTAILKQLEELSKKVRLMSEKHKATPVVVNEKKSKSTVAPTVGGQKLCGKSAPPYIAQRILQVQKNGEGKPINTLKLKEIVINANPTQIPFSLRALKTLWMNRLNLHFQTFTHSSIAQLPIEAQNFAESLKWSDVVDPAGEIPTLPITLIWKNVKQTETVSAATGYVPLSGEVNVLRHLVQLGPSEFATSAFPVQQNLAADAALDTIAQLAQKQSTKNRALLLKRLTILLGEQEFFVNDLLTIVDVAASSLTKQQKATDVPTPLANHLQRINEIVRYNQN